MQTIEFSSQEIIKAYLHEHLAFLEKQIPRCSNSIKEIVDAVSENFGNVAVKEKDLDKDVTDTMLFLNNMAIIRLERDEFKNIRENLLLALKNYGKYKA